MGVYYMDMAGWWRRSRRATAWADLGLPELYGTVAVNTTDPVRSNSGNMFAGLLANVLCGGVADEDSVEAVLPRLQAIFEKLGLYGGILLRPLRPVPQDRHGGPSP